MTYLFFIFMCLLIIGLFSLSLGLFYHKKFHDSIGIVSILAVLGFAIIFINPFTLALYQTKHPKGNVILLKDDNRDYQVLKKEDKITVAMLPKIYAIVDPYDLCFSDYVHYKTNERENIGLIFEIHYDVDIDSLPKYHEKVFNKKYRFNSEINDAFEKSISEKSKKEIYDNNEELVNELRKMIDKDLFERYGVKVKDLRIKPHKSSIFNNTDASCTLSDLKYGNFIS